MGIEQKYQKTVCASILDSARHQSLRALCMPRPHKNSTVNLRDNMIKIETSAQRGALAQHRLDVCRKVADSLTDSSKVLSDEVIRELLYFGEIMKHFFVNFVLALV